MERYKGLLTPTYGAPLRRSPSAKAQHGREVEYLVLGTTAQSAYSTLGRTEGPSYVSQ